MRRVRVTVWNDFIHERRDERVRAIRPEDFDRDPDARPCKPRTVAR